MSLIKDYFEKTNKYIEEYGNSTIVLMQVGAFFEVYGLKNELDGSVYGSCISNFSKICDLNVVDKKTCVGNQPVIMAGFKDMFLEKYTKKLQDAGYTIVVFVQDEQAPNTTRSLLGIFSPGTYFSCDTDTISNVSCCIWLHVIENVNKKNIFAQFAYSACSLKANSLNKKIIYIGIGMIDIYTGKSIISEFKEAYINNPTTFDELERIVSIYNPSETILMGNITQQEMDNIVNYTNIRSSSIHYISLLNTETSNKNVLRAHNCEKQIYQKQLFEKFYTIYDYQAFIYPFYEYNIATQAFCYLLDFLYQHNPYLINKIKEPIFENSGSRLILANHSLKQLNIIEDQYKGKYSSVVTFLNKCVTPMGKRKFIECFLNPTTNEDYLQMEYDIIGYCLENKMIMYDSLKHKLSQIADLSKINRLIILQKITPKNVYQLYISLSCAKEIYHLLHEDPIIFDYLKHKIPNVSLLTSYIDEIIGFLDKHLDIMQCKNADHIQKIEVNYIKPLVSEELDINVKKIIDSQDKLECCRKYFHSVLLDYETTSKKKTKKSILKTVEDLDLFQYSEDGIAGEHDKEKDNKDKLTTEYVKIHETEKNNYSLIATDRRCKLLEDLLSKTADSKIVLQYRSSNDGQGRSFELDNSKNVFSFVKQTASNKGIVSYQITELCKNVATIKTQLAELLSKVYWEIIEKLVDYQTQFELVNEFLTYVDFVFTKACIAQKYGYCKPQIRAEATKSFVKVDDLRHCLIEHIQQNELYVANDVSLGTDAVNGMLLYGTNAVGKTSFIRSLGIAVIMAQSGLFVPASSFQFKPYHYIFTRILGNDNLFKGLSTFAVEMSELRTILRLANSHSLVLGDELCSGTESISAMSIFVAGIQKLYRVESSFIFATHLHEITKYEEITCLDKLAICHMSVIYDKEIDALVYDRKLRSGPGNNMYGLEVCKSLSLPLDFLEEANHIRMKYYPESASILDLTKSHYNAKHVKGLCEKCGKDVSSEVHHLQHQKDADEHGMIHSSGIPFHKNHSANLLNLCKKCHDEFHETPIMHKKTKTTKGVAVKPIHK
uniref:DNA mismatch repair proteins mutS family domain-containing protein n=1 Tax=viral metagenome TaxID=1070528 RepID=A0A6C0E3T6_9ZZZZ